MVTSSQFENARGAVRFVDLETRAVRWETPVFQTGFSVPIFSPDGRRISIAVQETINRSAIQVLDATTGAGKVVARLPFSVQFRANWTTDGKAVIVNRVDATSHIVMFDRFWEP